MPIPYLNGKTPKIPPALNPLIFAKSGEGLNSEQIAEWLWREHRIEVGARVIRKMVRRHRTEQADAAKSVVREELQSYLIPAIARIAKVGSKAAWLTAFWLTKAAALREKAGEGNDCLAAFAYEEKALLGMDRQLKAADALLHYAGLDQPDAPMKQSAAERRKALLRRLEELTREPDRVAGSEGEPQVN